MKKIISQWTFDKLYEKSFEGLGTKDEEGNFTFYDGRFEKWVRRLDYLDENYIVVGPRIIPNFIRRKIHEYRTRHLSLGKVHYKDKDINKADFEITNIPKDLTYWLQSYLTIMIRDYLREFIKHSPVIGNCVQNEEDSNEVKAKRWKDLVNKTVDEFDKLSTYVCSDEFGSAEYIKLKEEAFKDLAFIFDDLVW